MGAIKPVFHVKGGLTFTLTAEMPNNISAIFSSWFIILTLK